MPDGSAAVITRPLRPADLLSLASLWAAGRPPFAYPHHNEAQTWQRLSLKEPGSSLFRRTMEQWLPFATARQSCLAVCGLAVRGLASARPRGEGQRRVTRAGPAWEIDCLLAREDEAMAASLLSHLCRSLGSLGGEKVFLRLTAASHLLQAARQAGFFPYLGERLLRIDGAPQGLTTGGLALRQRSPVLLFPLFQLYNAAVPAAVRRHEGPTLSDWLAAQEEGHCQHLVLAGKERPAAWLRIARSDRAGQFSLLFDPKQGIPLDHLLAAAIARLEGARPISCLVPEYQKALGRRLEELGFRPVAEYVVLVNRLARPVEEAVPVGEGVRQPYPAG